MKKTIATIATSLSLLSGIANPIQAQVAFQPTFDSERRCNMAIQNQLQMQDRFYRILDSLTSEELYFANQGIEPYRQNYLSKSATMKSLLNQQMENVRQRKGLCEPSVDLHYTKLISDQFKAIIQRLKQQ